MSLFEIANAAHLAGSLVLALFFALLGLRESSAYLRAWTVAWAAQALALAGLLLAASVDRSSSFGLYLFLETVHGALLCAAADVYRSGRGLRPGHLLWLLPLAAWAGVAPFLFPELPRLYAAQLVTLAAAYLAAAALLWRLRRHGGLGLRLTTNVLGLLGLLYLQHAAVVTWLLGPDAESHLYFGIAPFSVLLLQMLLGLGMVTTAMETAQTALSDANCRLQEAQQRLRAQADTDPLTGCFNRRVFRELVDQLRAPRAAARGLVLVVDMDDLKGINDRQGHQAGDAAIRGVADAIRGRTRDTDLVVRWGGDEFVVVLPGAPAADGARRRDQLAAAFAGAGLAASVGWSTYGDGRDIVAAVEEADRRMYELKAERKRLGRLAAKRP